MQLPPLRPGVLIRRYKRFLADVALDHGGVVTAHCANSGSMLGLNQPGLPVMLSHHDDPKRKLAWTLELVHTGTSWVGVHTGRTNALVAEALGNGTLPGVAGYARITPEARWDAATRLDFRLSGEGRADCWLEVKSVTLRENDAALFPDAVTVRGAKHLDTLFSALQQGHRAVILFVVQREDCRVFRPARVIDPHYAQTLARVTRAGVELMVMGCQVTPVTLRITHPMAWEI